MLCLLLAKEVNASIVYPNMEEVCKVTDCSVIYQPEAVSSLTVVDKIKATFPEEPRMVDVLWCESHYRQFDEFGEPLISDTSDVGLSQINQIHWNEAKKLGLDIFNDVDDNLKMARLIFDMQGIKAWYALESKCYKNLSSQTG